MYFYFNVTKINIHVYIYSNFNISSINILLYIIINYFLAKMISFKLKCVMYILDLLQSIKYFLDYSTVMASVYYLSKIHFNRFEHIIFHYFSQICYIFIM